MHNGVNACHTSITNKHLNLENNARAEDNASVLQTKIYIYIYIYNLSMRT